MLRLSQGQLTLLDYCPRRFQHTSLESLAVPPAPAQLAGQQWGDRFHLLMQQREMGLAIAPLLAQDTELQRCLAALQQTAPDLFDPAGETFRQSEHGRSLIVNGYWFTVVYDLLRQWGDRAEIIDWKTHLTPKAQPDLLNDWQTRLYLYILVETSQLKPTQATMTYWFVRAKNPKTGERDPQRVQIPYSDTQHDQTHQDLIRLTDRLTQLLATGDPFPQLPLGDARCASCPFLIRCQRGDASPVHGGGAVPDLDEIEEVVV